MPEELASPPSIKISWIFGILAAFLVFVVIATYSSRMAKDATDYDAQRGKERLAILAKQRASDDQALTNADWVDPTKNIVRIPIDEAIPEEIATLKSKPVKMGAEIPGAAPAKQNTIPATAENGVPAGATNAAPTTNAPPAAPPATSADAPNK